MGTYIRMVRVNGVMTPTPFPMFDRSPTSATRPGCQTRNFTYNSRKVGLDHWAHPDNPRNQLGLSKNLIGGPSGLNKDNSKSIGDDISSVIVPVASADDEQGLKMARAAGLEGGLRTPEEFERFHDEITGRGISKYRVLVRIAREIKEEN